jgi:peptidoglycan pentaglycine glycine transferase (the first glycine)
VRVAVDSKRVRVRFARRSERGDWNNSVAAALGGHLLQSWEWGTYKAVHGWRPLRVVLEPTGEPATF